MLQQTERLGGIVFHPIQTSYEVEMTAHAEVVKQRRIVGDVRQSTFQLDQIARQVTTGDLQRTGRGRNQAGQTTHRGRLAGPVRSYQATYLAGSQ